MAIAMTSRFPGGLHGANQARPQQHGQQIQQKFPFQLHDMLTAASEKGFDSVVTWLPCGKHFRMLNQELFEEFIMPVYFKTMGKYSSFQRQLNLYGFKRVSKGPDKGAYFHEKFDRSRRIDCMHIQRPSAQSARVKSSNPTTSCVRDVADSGGGQHELFETNFSLSSDMKASAGDMDKKLKASLKPPPSSTVRSTAATANNNEFAQYQTNLTSPMMSSVHLPIPQPTSTVPWFQSHESNLAELAHNLLGLPKPEDESINGAIESNREMADLFVSTFKPRVQQGEGEDDDKQKKQREG